MDVEKLLILLFGQVGALGTVCLIIAAYMGYLHHIERVSHNETREKLVQLGLNQIEAKMKLLAMVESLKELLETKLDALGPRSRK